MTPATSVAFHARSSRTTANACSPGLSAVSGDLLPMQSPFLLLGRRECLLLAKQFFRFVLAPYALVTESGAVACYDPDELINPRPRDTARKREPFRLPFPLVEQSFAASPRHATE